MQFNLLSKLSAFSLNKGHERSVRAKKHIFYSFGLKGISILISLVYVPLFIDYLDTERYGIWLTLSSILGWFEFFDIGLGNGLRNRFTEALAKNDHALARIYVSTTYWILTIIFTAVLIIFFIINPFLNWTSILNTTVVSEKELTLLALVVFTFFIVRFVFKLIGTILMADQRPAINNAFAPAGSIITLIIMIFLIKASNEGSLLIIGALLSIIPVLILISASIILFKGRYRMYSPSMKCVNLKYAPDLLKLGARFFILRISSIVLYTSSNIIITQILGPEEVTVYNIAYKYFYVPIMVFSIVMTPVWSAVTDAYIKNDFVWLKNILKKLNLISLIFVSGIILMLLMSGIVYRLWIGDRVDVPFILSAVMALYAIINVTLSPYSQFINGFGKLKISTFFVWFQVILFIPLAIYLTKSSLGVSGIMLATCLITGLAYMIEPVQTYKLLNKKANGIWNK